MSNRRELSQALGEMRIELAGLLNAIRLGLAATAGLSLAVLVWGFGRTEWIPSLLWVGGYAAVATVVWLAGRRSRRWLRASRLAVLFVELPLVFLVQRGNLLASATPLAVSEFSVGLFILLVMCSAFTVEGKYIALVSAVAIVLEQALQNMAGANPGGRLFSFLLLAAAGGMCIFAGRMRLALLTRVTEANVRRRRLQRYFSPGVGAILEEHDEAALAQGRVCELTLVFCDIRGFTAMSATRSAEEVVALLNRFHTRMVEAIFRYGGTLDKYLGDGVMAYFNAPLEQIDHAERALKAATAMCEELAALNAERARERQEPLRIGIGIHTGKAVVGDIGAPHRREFTAIGDAVNVASRLQEFTKEFGTVILLSEATCRQLPEAVGVEELGTVKVRGRAEAVRVFTPLAR